MDEKQKKLKDLLTEMGHEELYNKLIEINIKSIVDLDTKISGDYGSSTNEDFLKDLGIEDGFERQKIISTVTDANQEIGKSYFKIWLIIMVPILILILYLMFSFFL